MKKERFQVLLEASPSHVPAVVRLRKALKMLGRAYRLKCITVEPQQATADESQDSDEGLESD